MTILQNTKKIIKDGIQSMQENKMKNCIKLMGHFLHLYNVMSWAINFEGWSSSHSG